MQDGSDVAPMAGKDLEAVLIDRGFTRIRRMGNAAWQGQTSGRSCIVSVMPVGRTRYLGEVRIRTRLGFRLRVDVTTPVCTHLFFLRQSTATNVMMRWIHRFRGYSAIHPAGIKAGYCVVTNDADWAHGFCQQTAAMSAATALISDSATPDFDGSVYFTVSSTGSSTTGQLCYGSPTLTAEALSPARLDRILAGLGSMADVAEALPTPPQPIRSAPLGRLSQRYPIVWVAVLFAGALAVLGVGSLLLLGIGYLVFG